MASSEIIILFLCLVVASFVSAFIIEAIKEYKRNKKNEKKEKY